MRGPNLDHCRSSGEEDRHQIQCTAANALLMLLQFHLDLFKKTFMEQPLLKGSFFSMCVDSIHAQVVVNGERLLLSKLTTSGLTVEKL